MSNPAQDALDAPVTKGRIFAWGVWDWGSAAFNAVIVTFVYSVYLTNSVGEDLPGGISADTWLAWSLGLAGFFIAVLAPVTGQRADAGGRRKLSLGIWTGLTVLSMFGLFFVKNDYHYLWLGLLLMGLGSIFFEFAAVSYNAMLHQVSTPANIGRVSAFGWSMGYFGGIVLLLICYVGFIAPEVGWFGVTSEDGLNIRMVALFAAAWFAISAIPVLVKVPEMPSAASTKRVGFFASYRVLFRDLGEMYRTNPHTVYFLGASALFRDGLAAVFTFGAVLAVTVYDIAADDVLIFGVAANVVSAIGALTAGRYDDKVGPKGGDRRLAVRDVDLRIHPAVPLRTDGVLGFRPHSVPVRWTGAVLVQDVPGQTRSDRSRGATVRLVCDDGARGLVPGTGAVRVVHLPVRDRPGRHCRHPVGARRRTAGAVAGQVPTIIGRTSNGRAGVFAVARGLSRPRGTSRAPSSTEIESAPSRTRRRSERK